MLLVLAACEGGAAPGTAASTTAPPATTAADPLEAFARAEVLVGGEVWTVAVADTPALRAQGLMGVTGLGGLQGMLFVWDEDASNGFWMRNTLIPLDIAFLAADGSLVDLLSMVPCRADPCPTYRPSGPYRYALEVPAGGFTGLPEVVIEFP